MQDLPAQLDESGLARFFPGPGRGDVALTAYILAIAHAAGWPLPADARARMLKALEDYVTGRLDTPERPWLDARARLALRLNALEALARHGRATPELVSTVRPEPETWPTTALVDWLGLLLHSPALPGGTPCSTRPRWCSRHACTTLDGGSPSAARPRTSSGGCSPHPIPTPCAACSR